MAYKNDQGATYFYHFIVISLVFLTASVLLILINSKKNPIDIVCRYDGSTYALREGKKKKLSLKDYEMPFVSRHQKT